MDDAAVGRIAEGIADRWHVGSAPLADCIALRHLLSDEVGEHGELARKVVIDADNLFLQVRGGVNASEKLVSACGRRENTGSSQCGGIRVEHTGWNHIARERRALNDAGGQATRTRPVAVLGKNACFNLRGRRHGDHGTTKIASIRRRKRHLLSVVGVALDQPAPFHVVKEKGFLTVAVIKPAEGDRAANVEAEDV